MKFSEARQGRIFIIRLEDGDIVHEALESFAADQKIRSATLVILGGADRGSELVVGPEEGRSSPVNPLALTLADVHEVAGVGTIFPDPQGKPVLHMHMACGREAESVTGCIRRGVRVWQVMEAVLMELLDTDARRVRDPVTGFDLLQP